MLIKYKYTDKLGITGIIEVEGRLFVTKDKNGDDVFDGDSVKSGKRIFTIIWGKDTLRWRAKLEGSRYTTPLCQWAPSEQFELIKEQK